MKYLKMLGLAALAAMALTAVIGASAASATELCSTSTTPCSGTKYGTGTVLKGSLESGTKALLTNSITNVTCEASSVEGKTTSAGGAGAVSGEITNLTFTTNCKTASGTACTVTVVNLPYPASISGGGTAAGAESTLTVNDASGAGATVVCGVLINCTFTTKDAILKVTNGASTPTALAAQTLERSGGFCPATATWDAAYLLTSPDPLFVV